MIEITYPFACSQTVRYASGSFIEFMKQEMGMLNVRFSTKKNHLSTWKLLVSYRQEITFDDLNYAFICDFEQYLLQRNYCVNTIGKHMRQLKRYINLAINRGLMDFRSYPFRRYKIKTTPTKRMFLTPEELSLLERLIVRDKTQRRILDMFLFSCYTGLRFSDIVRLSSKNFQWINDHLWLTYSTQKTDVPIQLPLELLFGGRALPIYFKYMGRGRATLFDMPVTSNSYVNRKLKYICRRVVIGKPISFHLARHTYATLLLYDGVNITTIQKLLGHKNVRTTEIYSKVMDITVLKDLENANKLRANR